MVAYAYRFYIWIGEAGARDFQTYVNDARCGLGVVYLKNKNKRDQIEMLREQGTVEGQENKLFVWCMAIRDLKSLHVMHINNEWFHRLFTATFFHALHTELPFNLLLIFIRFLLFYTLHVFVKIPTFIYTFFSPFVLRRRSINCKYSYLPKLHETSFGSFANIFELWPLMLSHG